MIRALAFLGQCLLLVAFAASVGAAFVITGIALGA
jgi:hypothetical protein